MDEINGLVPGETILADITLADYWEKHYLPWASTNLKPINPAWLQTGLPSAPQSTLRHLTSQRNHHTNGNEDVMGQLAEEEQGGRTISHAKWVA